MDKMGETLSYIIASLSAEIEKIAMAISFLILNLFPFLPTGLFDTPDKIMLFFGFGGQGLFAMRFLIQWITSEGKQRSVIPIAFWYFSIGGGVVLLTYALWRQDLVIICGQAFGLFVYIRNLIFIYREQKRFR